jgi:hypothetical protein
LVAQFGIHVQKAAGFDDFGFDPLDVFIYELRGFLIAGNG